MTDRERILNIFDKCLRLKAYGADVFFYFSPHVNRIGVDIYENGWSDCDYTDDTNEEHNEIDNVFSYIDVNEESEFYSENKIGALETTLEDLLREKRLSKETENVHSR